MNRLRSFLLYMLLAGFSAANAQLQHPEELESLSKLPSKELYELGENAYQKEAFDRASAIFMVICSRYNENDNREEQRIYTKSFNRSGNLCYFATAYSSAMDFYLKALKIAERYDFDDLIGVIYGHIGNIYAANNDFESAVNAYKRALTYAHAFNNMNLASMALNNLVGAYYFKGEVDSSLHYSRLFENLNFADQRYLYDVYLNKALVLNGFGKNDSAKIYARKAILVAIENDLSQLCIGAVNSCIARICEDEGHLDSAIYYLNINEKLARETHSNDLLVATVRDLARIYDQLNVREKALNYKAEYLAISDSILSQNEFNALKNKQVFYELERNASTINSLNAIRALQRSGLLVLSIAVVVFIILVFILFHQKRKLKAAYMELYERNQRQLSDEILYKRRIKMLETRMDELRTDRTASYDGAAADRGRGKAGTGATGDATEDTGTEETGNTASAADTEAPLQETAAGGHTPGRKLIISEAQRHKIAQDILQVMETTEDYCSQEYNIEKLAAAIDSNARYVSEVINDVFGRNFRDLLNEYRIRTAMIRLSDIEHYGNLTIKAISESVGYKSQATFITAFTKFTGLKPGLYQKLAVERHAKGEI